MKFICGVPVWEDSSYWVYYGPWRVAYPQKTAGKYLWFSEFRSDLEHMLDQIDPEQHSGWC